MKKDIKEKKVKIFYLDDKMVYFLAYLCLKLFTIIVLKVINFDTIINSNNKRHNRAILNRPVDIEIKNVCTS